MRWLGAESNRRHVDFQSTALPTELPSQTNHAVSNAGSLLKQKTRLRPRLDRVRVAELMQRLVTFNDFAIDPGVFSLGARADYVPETMVDLNLKNFLAHEAA